MKITDNLIISTQQTLIIEEKRHTSKRRKKGIYAHTYVNIRIIFIYTKV